MDARTVSRLEAVLGAGVRKTRTVGGGCINAAFRVDLDDGRTVFVKTNGEAPADMFPEEARGLKALADADGPPIPVPLHAEADLLVTTFLPPGGRLDAGGWRRLGRDLAGMHRTTHAHHGFHADNYIGSTRQPNPWTEDGAAFFAEHRIGFQVRLAHERGLLDGGWVRRAERLMDRLDALLPADEPACLLHGDLWSGNVLAREDGVGCLVDPAVHFGFREADLAMTRLFGGFAGPFYAGYEEAWPLSPGAEDRVDLFNLYHVLNHANLFGGGYVGQAQGLIARYA